MRRLHEAHQQATTRIFEAIAAVAEEFLGLASSAAPLAAAEVNRVASLVSINHSLLCALGVGAPALEQVRAIAETEGLATKLTGAGGGGCAFTLVGGEILDAETAASAARAKASLEGCGEPSSPRRGGSWWRR